jgi:hypothetical protein
MDWINAEPVIGRRGHHTAAWAVRFLGHVIENVPTHDLSSPVWICTATKIVTILVPNTIERLILFLMLFTIVKRRQVTRSWIDQMITRTGRLKYVSMLSSFIDVVIASVHKTPTKLISSFSSVLRQSVLLSTSLIDVVPEHRVAVGIHVSTLCIRGRLWTHSSRRKFTTNGVAVFDLGEVFRIIGPGHQRRANPAIAGAAG